MKYPIASFGTCLLLKFQQFPSFEAENPPKYCWASVDHENEKIDSVGDASRRPEIRERAAMLFILPKAIAVPGIY